MSLTDRQRRFVEEYLLDLNATAAYRRAGYKAAGNAAETNAARLLRNDQVSAAIKEAQAARSGRTLVTADEVIRGLKDEAGRTGEGSSHSARVAAWTQLGKHLGLFVDRTRHEGGVTVEVQEVVCRTRAEAAAALSAVAEAG